MKEPSIEEKAKAYDEAIKVAQRFYNNSVAITKKGLEDIFPELKESDDERIRKEIIDFATKANNGVTSILANNYNFNKWLAWLEKQGKQKPAWSEEDENLFRCAIDAVKQESKVRTDGCLDEEVGGMVIDWLKSLKERVQPKQEWSEEDEKIYNLLYEEYKNIAYYSHSREKAEDIPGEVLGWLESLKNRVQSKQEWSEEDNIILSRIIADYERSNEEWFNAQNSLPHGRKIAWLKSLKDRVGCEVNCTTTKEWSEEDKCRINILCHFLEEYGNQYYGNLMLQGTISFLKSLRPQNHWKPSNEQMLAIDTAINVIGKGTLSGKQLIELQEQLKKLREE